MGDEAKTEEELELETLEAETLLVEEDMVAKKPKSKEMSEDVRARYEEHLKRVGGK